MSAQFITPFRSVITDEYASALGSLALSHLNRPLRHHRNGLGSLWERVAEGKTR